MNFKNFKLVQKLKEISPKIKWSIFNSFKDVKIASRYIDYLIPESDKGINEDNERLNNMVRDTLIKEFPNIQNMKSFERIVEATVHNIKRKQLEESGDFEEIEF